MSYHLNLSSKISPYLETAFGLGSNVPPLPPFFFSLSYNFYLLLNSHNAPQQCTESHFHFLLCNLVSWFFYLALLYLHDRWVFIQLLNSLFIASVLPRKDFIWFTLEAILWKSSAWNEDRLWVGEGLNAHSPGKPCSRSSAQDGKGFLPCR